MRVPPSLIIVETEATQGKIAVALDKSAILYAAIEYPRLPLWFKDEVDLLYRDFDTITYRTLNMINRIKKIISGSRVVSYWSPKQEVF